MSGKHPQIDVCSTPDVPGVKHRTNREEWNQTERDYPLDKCLHEWLEEQVARSPEAVAVEFEDQTLTYQ